MDEYPKMVYVGGSGHVVNNADEERVLRPPKEERETDAAEGPDAGDYEAPDAGGSERKVRTKTNRAAKPPKVRKRKTRKVKAKSEPKPKAKAATRKPKHK